MFRCLVNEERCSLNAVQLKYSPLFFSALHCMYYWCILLINCSGGGGVQLLFSWLPSLLMDRERSLDVLCEETDSKRGRRCYCFRNSHVVHFTFR